MPVIFAFAVVDRTVRLFVTHFTVYVLALVTAGLCF